MDLLYLILVALQRASWNLEPFSTQSDTETKRKKQMERMNWPRCVMFGWRDENENFMASDHFARRVAFGIPTAGWFIVPPSITNISAITASVRIELPPRSHQSS